jgi:hypothetical protein
MIGNDESQVGAQPSWLDDVLRAALTDIPDEQPAAGAVPADMVADIGRAIDDGWPQGRPPTLEELAADGDADDGHDGHRSTELTHEQSWADPVTDEASGTSHPHGWHHHYDHSAHIDPEHDTHP